MKKSKTDSDWEYFAKDEPYWAVLTQERFRKQNLNERTKAEFFATGEEYIAWVFKTVREHIDPTFNPRTALDFGCGVGRLVIPLGKRCQSAIGIDVSESMLREAQAACELKGVKNVRFLQGIEKLSASEKGVDFINSFVVFQHIACERGLDAFQRLIGLLADGGVGAIQITFSKDWFSTGAAGALPVQYAVATPPPSPDGFLYHLRGMNRAARRIIAERIFGRLFSPELAKPAQVPDAAPVMQMNSYVLNPILHILMRAGVRAFYAAFSDHSGSLGLVLFFRKKKDSPYSHNFLHEK